MQDLRGVIEKQFGEGVRVRQVSTNETIGTTATRVLGNNPKRVGFTIVNSSANNVYALAEPEVASDNGIFLGPNGGFVTYSYETEGDAVGEEFFCVASAGSTKLTIIQFEIV